MFQNALSFDQDLSSFDISGVSDMTSMLSNSNFSTANYDATLIGWDAQTVTAGVPLGSN